MEMNFFLPKWPQWNNTCNELQVHMHMKWNIRQVCIYSFRFSCCFFFSHEDLVPVWNFILTKIIDMKSIVVWVSFRLNSCDHKQRADWTSKWDFRTKLNLIPVWVHFASHVNVLLKRKQNALKLENRCLFF